MSDSVPGIGRRFALANAVVGDADTTVEQRSDRELIAIGRLLGELRAHDESTYYHVRSVGRWCRRLALELGATAHEADFIERSGALHDIGKLDTPLSILNKPDKLAPQEWKVMQEHADRGADRCSATPGLERFAAVVRAHHERPDGRGYPRGLTGAAIPIEAQIVSVADSFHAMISLRSYARAKSPREAFRELERASGAQFGTVVVNALFRVVGYEGQAAPAARTIGLA